MRRFNLNNPTLITLIALLVWSSDQNTCNARQGNIQWRQNIATSSFLSYKNGDASHYPVHHRATRLMQETTTTFNVLNYGAKGNGATDDTKAFEAAWTDACKVQASTMVVPSGSVFLVNPISFSGPNCESNIVFQLDGKIIAPTGAAAWGSGLLQWIEFTKLKGITIQGKGIIDGQGSVWWNDLPADNPAIEAELVDATPAKNSNYSSSQDLALRFYGSTGVTVNGITIQNSPQAHLKFDDCTSVQVSDVTISSPGDSPNTDGIHLQNSQDVVIHSSNLACGISANHTHKHNSRLYTQLQGGSGSVQGVMFSNIQVSAVETPIKIDQYYCDGSKCQNKSSAVSVSGINYQNIKGTYTLKPVQFACSDSLPCTGVTLTTIELKPLQEKNQLEEPFCWKTYGELRTSTTPPIDCLLTGKPSSNQVHSNYDSC
ncbi:hypothetical protein LguiB_011340 [Lonicera macranthoides]